MPQSTKLFILLGFLTLMIACGDVFIDAIGAGALKNQNPGLSDGGTNGECPAREDPSVHYINPENDISICTSIFFSCETNQAPFSDECGCGCIDIAPIDAGDTDAGADECPDRQDPKVHYYNEPGDFQVCLAGFWQCEQGQLLFNNHCGCGCIDQ